MYSSLYAIALIDAYNQTIRVAHFGGHKYCEW